LRPVVATWLRVAAATAAAILVLELAHVPSPTLFGGLIGALTASLRKGPAPALPRSAYLIAQATIGLSAAAMIDTESLRAFASDWLPITLVCLATLTVSAGAGLTLSRFGVAPITAIFATIAGGASGMTAVADDLGADSRVVTVVQYLRVLIILLLMPVVVTGVFDAKASGSPIADAGAGLEDYVFTVVAIILGITLGKVARIPSPAILGTLVVGAALVLSPPFEGASVPVLVQLAGFMLIGTQVGLRFNRASLAVIGRLVPAALALILVIVGACALLGVLLAKMTGESGLDSYLATTPGGLPAVLATSTDTSGNVTFVTATQLLRLIVVLLLAPLVAQVYLRWPRGQRPDR
jgi:membrane AbrB-like protein